MFCLLILATYQALIVINRKIGQDSEETGAQKQGADCRKSNKQTQRSGPRPCDYSMRRNFPPPWALTGQRRSLRSSPTGFDVGCLFDITTVPSSRRFQELWQVDLVDGSGVEMHCRHRVHLLVREGENTKANVKRTVVGRAPDVQVDRIAHIRSLLLPDIRL